MSGETTSCGIVKVLHGRDSGIRRRQFTKESVGSILKRVKQRSVSIGLHALIFEVVALFGEMGSHERGDVMHTPFGKPVLPRKGLGSLFFGINEDSSKKLGLIE